MYRSQSRSPDSDTARTDKAPKEAPKKVVTYVKKNLGVKAKNKTVEERLFHEEEEEEEGAKERSASASEGSTQPSDSDRGSEVSQVSGAAKQRTPKKAQKDTTTREYGPNSPTGKKAVNDWTIAPEVEVKAVPWLEAHDILWDKRHPQKNRKDLIEQTWEEMAREFPPYSG